ncbi:hypothetical protein [Cohnella thermotolerans]|uniref:hypothetical protein n=1 Tax=Cohnella thermotolerans TaxID=329858 RepID=UPI00047EE656|nr:hypothetical protein [Cohnella thermotolerans]
MGVNIGKTLNNLGKDIQSTLSSAKKEVTSTYNNAKSFVNTTSTIVKQEFSRGVKDIIVDPFKQTVKSSSIVGPASGTVYGAATSSGAAASRVLSAAKGSAAGAVVEFAANYGINAVKGLNKYLTGQQ